MCLHQTLPEPHNIHDSFSRLRSFWHFTKPLPAYFWLCACIRRMPEHDNRPSFFFVLLLMCFHQILAQTAQTMNAYHCLWIRKLVYLFAFGDFTVAFYICIICLHQASTRTVKYTQCLIRICWKFSVYSVPPPQPPPPSRPLPPSCVVISWLL